MQEDQMLGYIEKAVNETCGIVLSSEPEVFYFDNFDQIEEESVISSIGFAGKIEGSCTVCLPDSSACNLVSKMLGTAITEVNDQVLDGVGEFVNMIIGSIKMSANKAECAFEISIPTFIKGSRMVVLSSFKNAVNINRSYKLEQSLVFNLNLTYRLKEDEAAKLKKKQEMFDKLKNLGG